MSENEKPCCDHAAEVLQLQGKLKAEWLLRSRFQHRVDALEQALVWAAERDKAMQAEILALTPYPSKPRPLDDVALAV